MNTSTGSEVIKYVRRYTQLQFLMHEQHRMTQIAICLTENCIYWPCMHACNLRSQLTRENMPSQSQTAPNIHVYFWLITNSHTIVICKEAVRKYGLTSSATSLAAFKYVQTMFYPLYTTCLATLVGLFAVLPIFTWRFVPETHKD